MQDAAIVLCLKIVLISGFVSLTAWIAVYSRLAPWWTSPIGRTLVAKTALIALLFIPTTLSLFFHLSARDSRLTGWVDVILIGLVTPVMTWRTVVWLRIDSARKAREREATQPMEPPSTRERGDAP